MVPVTATVMAFLPLKRVGSAWEGDHRRVAWFSIAGAPEGLNIPVGTGMRLSDHLRRRWDGELDLPSFMVVDQFVHVPGGAMVRAGEDRGVPVVVAYEHPGAMLVLAAHDLERAQWN